jgi:transcriptional regulator with XRE-family HTH domain
MTNQTELTVLDELARSVVNRADFAKAVGIGQVYLSQILTGKRPLARLPAGTLLKFSKISGIPLERLAAHPVAVEIPPPLVPGGGLAE